MIKKSLGMALLSASLLTMAACSSDDDDGDTTTAADTAGTTTDGEGTTTDGEGTTTDGEGTTTDGEGTTTDGEGTTTDGEGTTTDGEGTTTDGEGTTTGSETDLTPGGYIPGTLTAVVEAAGGLNALLALREVGLDQALNDSGNAWTVFLPTDAALAAFSGEVNVQTHIYLDAPVDSTAATGLSGTSITMNDQSMQMIAGGGTEALTIGGASIVTPDLTADGASTIVHLIDGVLVGN